MHDERRRESEEAADGAVAPGALTALLHEVARAPSAERGSRWDEALRPGAVVGRFELVREVGRGGFGVVFEARDRELGRSVAFKAVRAGDQGSIREERLVREAEAAARLSHPNIVTLHDVGRCEHGPYLVLELLRGETLAQRIETGPVPPAEAARIATEVARGLAHAHAQGVVHRDLTPGNVFLCEDGQVKVLDFGLAHVFGQRRVQAGTPAYMAPEQWRGAPEDERTDVFALGVILFRMVAGRHPFPDDGGRWVSGSRPAPPLEAAGAPGLDALVERMLARDPVERPRDGAEVVAALGAVSRALEGRTPDGPPGRSRRGRRVAVAVAAAAAIAVALAGAGLAVRARLGPEAADVPAAAGEARVTVAVADFENQTGEAELSGLSGLLITSLEQSRRLSVLTRVRMLDVLRQLGKDGVPAIDEPLGREVARSAGARALVLATIRRFDQLYAIELKVLDPARSEYLFTLQATGEGKRSIPGMIDRLSTETRERLRESPAEVRASSVSVAAATTASFEAYAHYFRGEQHQEATRYEPALASYRSAIAADPGFALAHYQLAYLGEFTGLDAATRTQAIEAAIRNVDRVPAKERLLILAWKAHMERRDEDAHALYAQAVADYPEDKHVLYMAGDLFYHQERTAEALPLFEKALALDPTWEPALMHLTDTLADLGRVEELTERSRWWVEHAPSGSAHRALAKAHLLAGRWQDALETGRRALELDGSIWSRTIYAEALMLAERYEEAEKLLRPAADPSARGSEQARGVPSLSAALAYQGKRREALAIMDGLPRDVDHKWTLAARLIVHLVGEHAPERALPAARSLAESGAHAKGLPAILALAGDAEGAARAAEKLPPGPARTFYDGVAALRAGDPERAYALLRSVGRDAEPGTRAPALWVRSRLALETGRDAEALEAIREFQGIASGVLRAWGYPRSVYDEALAHERLGRPEKARERLAHLFRLWKQADRDDPLLAQARTLRARLDGLDRRGVAGGRGRAVNAPN